MENKLIEVLEAILTAPSERHVEMSNGIRTKDSIIIKLPTKEFKAAEKAFWEAKGYTEPSAIAEKMRKWNDSA